MSPLWRGHTPTQLYFLLFVVDVAQTQYSHNLCVSVHVKFTFIWSFHLALSSDRLRLLFSSSLFLLSLCPLILPIIIWSTEPFTDISLILPIYVIKTSSLSTVVKPTMTRIKQQKYFWHPTSTEHISLLLIYAIRPWPYMRISAWSQWIAIYLHIRLKYIQKHKASATI